MTSTSLLLNRLHLRNFRCFADSTIELHDRLTVLVAENGRGKTAILDGIGIALGSFVDAASGTRQFHGFERADVRLVKRGDDGEMGPELPTEFTAEGFIAGQAIRWKRSLYKDSRFARSSTKDAKAMMAAAMKMAADLVPNVDDSAVATVLPLVAFYGTGRLWNEHRLTKSKRTFAIASSSRLSGYSDCLSSSSSFKGVVAWYENKMNEIGDPKFARELSRNVPLVNAVQEAVRVVLEPTGWRELNWSPRLRSLVVSHPEHGTLPITALSDGVRTMVALVADIAHRCARLNPQLSEEAAQRTPGVLLIDEVDMHLHPRWQQRVVKLLQDAFPALQIILSTHSPHVLSTVDKSSIRVIGAMENEDAIEVPRIQTKGVESADVLATVMRLDPIPPEIEEAIWLRNYRNFIEDGKAEAPEAQSLREKIITHFGEDHPLVADCDRLIRFQAFRLKRKPSEDGKSDA